MAGEFAHFRIVIGGKEVDAATMDGKVVHLREYLDPAKLLARLGHATAVRGGG
jgi:hypothetical protein